MTIPWSSLAGGLLIGAAASLLLVRAGRVAGISGIVGGLLDRREVSWRAWFVAGLVAGGVVLRIVRPQSFGASVVPLPLAALAGVLVGVGTRLGNGCTSGHGVCGLSRLSGRSLAATLTFMATGIATACLVQGLLR